MIPASSNIFLRVLIVLLLCSACSRNRVPSVQERVDALGKVDFNFHVKPILADHCFTCHGPHAESREAGLSLHTQNGLLASLRDDSSRHVIVPGDPSQSELIRRITSPIRKERMPPSESPGPLSEYDIALLKRWVQQGAEWKPHWAFIPPEKPSLPSTRLTSWARNDIDHFVLARLEREGLVPSEEADRRTLIRRLYLDLTGLPPSGEEMRALVADTRADAYERLTDRLLDSPHYGERLALHWLDLARYADTNGYSIDGGRHMWLWRDWVIHAFNENKPFNIFVTEQLAGDMLEGATDTQRIATGFHRNHMITHEGGTIPEENLTNYVADRVKTSGEIFLGLTLACAQCHDHKYDPISQEDYYRFFAFFNTVEERGLDGNAGINALPSLEAQTPLHTEAEVAAVRTEIGRLQSALKKEHAGQASWETALRQELTKRGQGLALHSLRTTKVTTPNSGFTGQVLPDGSVYIDHPGGLAAYNVSLRLAQKREITGLRIVFYPHPQVQQGNVGYGDNLEGSFVLTSIHVSTGTLPSDQVNLHQPQTIRRVTASHAHADYPAVAVLDERRINGWSPHPNNRERQHLTLTFEQPLNPAETPFVTLMLNFGMGNNLIAGHFRVFSMEGADDGSALPPGMEEILFTIASERTPEERQQLQTYFAQTAPIMAPLRHQITNLEERLDVLSRKHSAMVMNVAAEPRETFVLERGQYDQPLERVDPDVPSVLPSLPANAQGTRLDLALWLTDPQHPLTARVTVNRLWQMLFGRGLVATAADFGTRGALPSHPELLDWLAVQFVENGWDVKNFLRTVVLSSTYRQSSATPPQLLEIDPDNRLLTRGPRFRLQAEFVRDAALRASGLLVPRLGGPSVNPYQPVGLWKEISHYGSTPATAQVFVQDHAEKLYRRSLYTYWKRTAPPPSMLVFDAPTREVCTVTRETTNTPLQALVMLNDPQFVEASRVLAQRILGEPVNDRLTFAYEEVTGRLPDKTALHTLQRRLDEEIATFTEEPVRAAQYVSVGEAPRDTTLNLAEHAAWTTIASLLLNLSETITRN